MTACPGTGKKALVLALHAIVLWALCAAVMGVGMSFLPLRTTLVVHALAAPVFAAAVAAAYTSRFGHVGPLATASFFLAFVMVVDFFLVALVINRNLDMFESILGTWLPFASIFAAAFAAALLVRRRRATGRTVATAGPGRSAP